MSKFYNRVHLTHKTEADWLASNPTLLDGEIVVVLMDSGATRLKVGDGVSTFSDLGYVSDSSDVRLKVGDGARSFSDLEYVQTRDGYSGGGNYSELEERVTNVETEVNSVKADLNTVKSKAEQGLVLATNVRLEFDTLSEQVSKAVKDAQSASSVATTMATDVSTNKANISKLTTTTNLLTSRVGEHDTKIDKLTDDLATTNTNVTEVATTLQTHEQKYENLKLRVDNLVAGGGDIGDLEGDENGVVNINVAEVVDIRMGYDGTLHKSAGDAVRALGAKLDAPIDPEDLGLVRDESTGMIHPTYKGVRSSIGVVAGGVSGAGMFRLRNIMDSSSLSVSYGDEVTIKYTFAHLDEVDAQPTGNGTAQYSVNGSIVYTASIPQGDISFECSKWLKEGDNVVSVTVKNADGDSKSLEWNVNCIAIRLEAPTFQYSQFVTADENGELNLTFNYYPYGAIEKKIYFILDGIMDSDVQTVNSSGIVQTKIFKNLRHGVHTIEVYATAVVNDTVVTSNTLKYDVIAVEENVPDPIISINCNTPEVIQGELVDIPYIVYTLSTESEVELTISAKDENGEYQVYKTEQRKVDRSVQHWTTRNYPLGDVRFTVKVEDTKRSFDIKVNEFEIDIEPTTNNLELHLSSGGRSNSEINPAVWESNGITTTFNNVNWATSGWLPDSNGDTALHLTGGATATINFKPFNKDLRVLGKTIEFEFAIRDVNNRDAKAISCSDGKIGIEITADQAVMASALDDIRCYFTDERKLRLTFTIESVNEYRMMSAYIDGVLTNCTRYVETDNFQQEVPVNITIGSPLCSVDLYTVRSYSRALTHMEVVNNYICDTLDIAEKSTMYERNNLYDVALNLDYNLVKKHIPVMTITGPLPQYKGDKKKPVKDDEGNVVSYTNTVSYYDPFDEEMCFEDKPLAQLDVQGTSSQWYVRKNYKLKFEKKFAHIKGEIPTKTYCVKADYAEATSTHNTQIANIAQTLYYDKTPAQKKDSRCRTTIEGFPMVIYHKATPDSTPMFLGKYNWNYDKGSEEAFGFTDDYEVECWEFCNNTSGACNFTAKIDDEYEIKAVNEDGEEEVVGGWVNDFERRYPDHETIDDGTEVPSEAIARFRAMHDWIVESAKYDFSDKTIIRYDPVFNDKGEPEYEKNADGSTVTNDDGTPKQKMEALDALGVYRKDFQQMFNLSKVLVYYVWTFFFLMVDQRAKNMFMTYWAETGKWEPWLYDNDTCLGINNEGHRVFDYYHEDTDIMPDGTKVYNGQDSVLWVKFREAFASEIKDMYRTLRSDNKIGYKTIRDYFVTNGSDKWSETIYNEDSDYKYISMLRNPGVNAETGEPNPPDATNLPQIKGTGEHHLEYFLNGRVAYCDSKWDAVSYKDDYINVRINTPTEWADVEPCANITVTPFSNMYAGVKYKANGTLQQTRLSKNQTYTFIPLNPNEKFNDTETAIFGASQLSSIGDLSPLYCNYCDISKASKLVELKLGSESPNYVSKLKTLSLGTNRLLKKLDIRNCKSLTSPVDLSGCVGIEEIYAEGSCISGVELADSGYLRIAHLPETITTLTVKNQKYITDFSMPSFANLERLRVEHSPSLPLADIIHNAPLKRIRLLNVEWEESSEEALMQTIEKLKACKSINVSGLNDEDSVIPTVTGIVTVPTISVESIQAIQEFFPELMIRVNGKVLCLVTYKTYKYDYTSTGEIAKETVETAWTEIVEQGATAPDPVALGHIATPTRAQTATHRYTYRGWSRPLENIEKSITLVAAFDVEYGVLFMVDDKCVHTQYVKEGGKAVDPVQKDLIPVPTKESTVQYDFTYNKWDKAFNKIEDVTYVYALFTSVIRKYDVYFYNENGLRVLEEQEQVPYGTEIVYGGKTPEKENIENLQEFYPQDYTFLGWKKSDSNETLTSLGTVGGPETFFASFSAPTHITDTWAQISASVADGSYKQKYPVGVKKRIKIGHTDNTFYEVPVMVVGHDHDISGDGRLTGLTFMALYNLRDKGAMMDTQQTNDVSWARSPMRTHLENDVKAMLPSELINVIVPVKKKTVATGFGLSLQLDPMSDSTYETVTDSLWIPSLIELVDIYEPSSASNNPLYYNEGDTYEYYRWKDDEGDVTIEDANARRQRKRHDGAVLMEYWVRTPFGSDKTTYFTISSAGLPLQLRSGSSNQGIAIGFCVGIVTESAEEE